MTYPIKHRGVATTTLQVTLPDGTTAMRRTRYKHTLAVCRRYHDEVLGDVWTVFKWTSTVAEADRQVAKAKRLDDTMNVAVLHVTDLMDPLKLRRNERA